MSKYRYPGPKPFTDKDKELFFGRKEERILLINLIKNNRLNILFGRSGNGKSSLIHAALIPYFETERYKIIEIRVQPFHKSVTEQHSLINQIVKEFKKYQVSKAIYLNEILPENHESSLWQYFKTLQWDFSQKGYEGIIFIIDQFEELFNFPIEQFRQFAKEFSEIIYNRTPYKFQEALNNKIKFNADFITENQYKIEFTKLDFFSSFLIGIRSDRLYLLDELGDMIPMIFNNRFRLDHLSAEKIEDVIKKPAQLNGDFASPTFEISEEIIQEIKDYLFDKSFTTQQNYFETFQLQIICQYIEKQIIQITDSKRLEDDIPEQEIIVTKELLLKQISEIIREYYEDVVKTISFDNDPHVRLTHELFIRFLIEKKLIDVKTNSRICLDKTSIDPIGIDDQLLGKLIESKIIRKEINTVSGESFEISHDSLVRPILLASSSNKLGDLEIHLYNYYLMQLNAMEYTSRQSFKTKVLPQILNKEGNILAFKLADFPERLKLPIEELEKKYIIAEKIDDKKKGYHIINEAFRNAIIKKRNEDSADKQKAVKFGIFALLVSLVILIVFAIQQYNQHKIDNSKVFLFKNTSLFSPSTNSNVDTIISVKKLILLSELYKIIKPEKTTIPVVGKYLISYFNSNDFIGKRLAVNHLFPYYLSVNNKKELLVIYTNQKPRSSNNVGNAILSAYLYDKNGKNIVHYSNIYSASFDSNSNLVILKKDSIIIRKKNDVTKLRLINRDLKISTITIDSIRNDNIFCLIRPMFQSPAAVDKKSGQGHHLFNSTYFSNYFEMPLIPAIIDYTGNISQEKPKQPKPYTDYYDTTINGQPSLHLKKFKDMELKYDGRIVSIRSGKHVKTDTLDNVILDVSFSTTGDSVFVNDGSNLTILDKSLTKLSKFRNDVVQNGKSARSNLIAYSQSYYVVVIDLDDNLIKTVNTLDPESIIRYINGVNHTVSWQELSEKDRKAFGYAP